MKKRIAFIAHDNKKDEIVELAGVGAIDVGIVGKFGREGQMAILPAREPGLVLL